MQKTFFSRHIPKTSILDNGADIVTNDLVVFNKMKHTAVQMHLHPAAVSLPAGIDLRKKENEDLRKSLPPSVHMQLKEKYKVNDYFASSANQSAAAAIKSVKELQSDNLDEKKFQLKQVNARLAKCEKQLAEFQKTKACLIARSKAKKAGKKRLPKVKMPKGNIATFDKATGVFTVWHTNLKTLKRTKVAEYKDDYCFEIQYLNPKIKRLISQISGLKNRIKHLEAVIAHMASAKPSICFGSKALFRKQDTVYSGNHEGWLNTFHKARYSGMTIPGRKDSKNGNYVFRYDSKTHELTYHSMNGTAVVFPGVVFPYGQALLDEYINKQITGECAYPIAWRIEETGGSFLIKCTITIADPHKNEDYSTGCIAFDTNVDHLAVSETDAYGNLVSFTTIPFHLDGVSSEKATHILSETLEKVFALCAEKHKPLAAEDLKDVATTELYGSAKRNRKLSAFAHTKIRELTDSKSGKYGIGVRYVNPAYTSQMGKVRYMRLYGLSIHTSAAFVIGRRAMGFHEPIPKSIRSLIPEDRLQKHHWSHWAFLYKKLKDIKPHEMYALA